MSLLSAALTILLVLMWRPPWVMVRVRLHRWRQPGASRRSLAAAVIVTLLVSLVALPTAPTLIAWTALAITGASWNRLRRITARRRRDELAEEALRIIDALVAELRSGAEPAGVLRRLSDEAPVLGPVAAAAVAGGDVAAALQATGARPGGQSLDTAGRAWAISQATGAALAPTLERVRDAARSDRDLERELAAAAAPARATATLLAVMPVLGLALGSGLGVDPVSVVVTTVPGAACAAVGVAFAIAGVTWIDRLADQLETGR